MPGQLDKWLWQLNQVKRSCGQVKRSSDPAGLTSLCPEAMQAQCKAAAVVCCWAKAEFTHGGSKNHHINCDANCYILLAYLCCTFPETSIFSFICKNFRILFLKKWSIVLKVLTNKYYGDSVTLF